MNKLYNNFDEVASDMFNYFKNCIPSISKNHLKFLPNIILGMVDSESVVTSDISSSINSDFFSNNTDTIQKRVWRFLNNVNVDIYYYFN